MNPSTPASTDIEQLARRRAAMKMGWLIHASVFVAVNGLLALLAFSHGRHWVIYPFFGWGLGLAIHGLVVLLAMPGGSLMAHLVERERQRLERHAAARQRP